MMTPEQKTVYDLHTSGKGFTEIARTLGISRRSARNRYERALQWETLDPGTKDAMEATNSGHIPRRYWSKTKNNDGTSYSVLYEIPQTKVEDDWLERLKNAFEDIPAAPVIRAPKTTDRDLMTVYPWFDVHLGLRSEKAITGEDYDLEIAAARLKDGMGELMSNSPDSRKGVIINGGDFTHADDDENATPAHKHVLDVACRNYTTVDAAIEVISAGIEMALTKHEVVEYYSVPGNHDPKNWVNVMFALFERYRNNPRVKIEKSPLEISVIVHNEVLIIIHHGHKRDVKELIMWFVATYPMVWANATHRVLYTGHKHGKESKAFPGVEWEQFAAITAADHYAATAPFWSCPEMQAITFNTRSEKTRTKVKL